ncbi:MAG: FMN-binding negative transcriptional regulator [Pseudomonas sp.]|uniref:FMN-binding negative transcriptional regulator n=1 Tax=Pseudomonas sp. TaxID=306 RepID=UPI002733E3C0|nr:FMN-binding negative transcriptional regulator [Pseudomonas sp.]MDP3847703.1 FMN-binding negative transcriptional regulator [Pseudomonas sp.]
MYIPAAFQQHDLAQLHGLIHQQPLATLISHGGEGLQANHLPLWLAADEGAYGTLYGHCARANPQWRELAAGAEVLAIFTGAEGYISPSWYPTKAEHGKAVPTWDYQSVHAYGQAEVFDDAERLLQLLGRLTAQHESPQPQPWAIADAPHAYIDKMLQAIVGFSLPIQRLEGQWKLSQNRNTADRAGVQQALSASPDAGAQELAQQIKTMR